MKVSTDSWHYGIVESRSEYDYVLDKKDVPTNLCPYMRRLLWGMIVIALKWVGITAGTIVVGFILVAPLVAPLVLLAHSFITPFLPASWLVESEESLTFFQLLVTLGFTVYALAVAAILVWGGIFTIDVVLESDWYNERRKVKLGRPKKQPSVFTQFLRDWHHKTCTPIEFVEAEQTDA